MSVASPDCTVPGVTHHSASLDGIRMHWAEAGAGPAVLLLHGFPDYWFGWRHQIAPLAAAGYRVIAPDLRGYNRSGRPHGVAAYALTEIAGDVVDLMHAINAPFAAVIGHDWGGVVAWRLALHHAGLVPRLGILNAPHPALYTRMLPRSTQLLRSWYAGFFQLPVLPEAMLRARGMAALKRALRDRAGGRDALTRAELRCYRDVLGRAGALTPMLNYYRAAARGLLRRRDRRADQIVRSPTLVVWGERDRYLSPRLLDGLPELVPALRIERLADAGHFVHWHEPVRVNRLLLELLRGDVLRAV